MSAAWYCSHYLPPVSTTLVATLLPVLLIPVARRRCWHRRQICRQYHWHRWKICRWCQQYKRTWWQICHRCQRLDLLISPRIFEKIRNDPNVIFRGLGLPWEKVIHEKNLKQKISWHCPLKLTYSWNGQFFALPTHQAGICPIACGALNNFPHYF